MNRRSGYDLAGGVLGIAALVLGVLAVFWVPFAFAPLGVLCLVIAVICSSKYKGLYEVAAVAIVAGVIIGGWIAVVLENPLF